MDAYQIIQEDIKKFISKWIATGLIFNPQISGNFYKDTKFIQSKYNFYKSEQEYLEKFVLEYEKGNYLFALSDGSCFQLCYEFEYVRKKAFVKKANLCFLPCVTDGEYSHEYIRLDYDSSSNSFSHAATHLHIGFREGMRIPVDDVPLLSEFFEFVLYLYYPDEHSKYYKSGKSKNTFNIGNGRLTKGIPISNELLDYAHLTVSKLIK